MPSAAFRRKRKVIVMDGLRNGTEAVPYDEDGCARGAVGNALCGIPAKTQDESLRKDFGTGPNLWRSVADPWRTRPNRNGQQSMDETDLTGDSIVVPSPDIVAREIEGRIVIVPLASGVGDAEDNLYSLSDTGKAVWERVDGESTLTQIAASMAEEFDASVQEIESDVIGFASELLRRGILAKRTEG